MTIDKNAGALYRYHKYTGRGIYPADAQHLAWAESAGAELFTTDDTVIKVIKKYEDQITIVVKNPVVLLMEVNALLEKYTE